LSITEVDDESGQITAQRIARNLGPGLAGRDANPLSSAQASPQQADTHPPLTLGCHADSVDLGGPGLRLDRHGPAAAQP
jgi:hypothetical protein